MDFAIRQAWLAAFRNFKELPAATQKKDILALARLKGNNKVLYEMAYLLNRLGFDSDRLSEIMRQPVNQDIALNALLAARNSETHTYRDPYRYIQQILDVFATATPIPEKNITTDILGEVQEHRQPLKRPQDLDHGSHLLPT